MLLLPVSTQNSQTARLETSLKHREKQPSLDRKNHKCQRPGFLKQETLAVVLNKTVVKHVNYTCQLARLRILNFQRKLLVQQVWQVQLIILQQEGFLPSLHFCYTKTLPERSSHVTSNRVSMTSQDLNSRLRTRGVLLRCFWSEKMVTMLHVHIEDMRLSIHFFLLDSEAGPHRYVREASEKGIPDGMCGLMVIHLKGCCWSEGDDQDGLMSGKALWNGAWICVQSFWSVQST